MSMQRFADLMDCLVYTQSRTGKLALLEHYFRTSGDPDRGWALAALTDGLPLRLPLRRVLEKLMAEKVDPTLYRMSRDYVGDTAETVALLWPDHPELADGLSLDGVVTAVSHASPAELPGVIGALLDRLDARGRWALLKLIGGAPRVGVSSGLAKTGVSAAIGIPVAEVQEVWHALGPPYTALFEWAAGLAPRPDALGTPVFRPLMLATPIEEPDWAALDAADFAAEWKWDGIRIQVAAAAGTARLFSRSGDDISGAFPEIASAFAGRTVTLDGELLVVREGVVAPFNDLQQRLNRKVVSARLRGAHPAHVRLYDMLAIDGEDVRSLPFVARRDRLEVWHAASSPPLTDISPLIPFQTFEQLSQVRASARAAGIEGLMLKRKDSPYLAGRIKGHWFKWKRDALTLDCVLMYAQRGSGKRSSYYSDYTFGVWRETAGYEPELVPVGKAYSGFTDEELRRLDSFVRRHTLQSFGPVRAVEQTLVLEVAFDAVQASARHKSGVAMRFPRIHRIRWDKPAAEADTLATVKALIDGTRSDSAEVDARS